MTQDNKLTVIARFKAKPGQQDALRKMLIGLIEPTRKEVGCINYDLHDSIDNPQQFVFHENWTSREALDRHLATPHLTAFLGTVDALLAEPIDLTLWRMTP